MKIHHIGIATEDISKTELLYTQMGYVKIIDSYDNQQKVNIIVLHKNNEPLIELVGKSEDKSPIDNFLDKNGTGVYHICYSTNDMDSTINEYRLKGFIQTVPVRPSVFGKKVVFLWNRDMGIIEFIED